MNYINIYKKLIRKTRKRYLELEYSEVHHIIPRCLGGKDNKSNLITLSTKEHYIAHLLLVKIFETRSNKNMYFKLLWAVNMMTQGNSERKELKSRLYANSKGLYKHSEETKEKMRTAHLGRVLSKETRDKISNTRKERLKSGDIKPLKGKGNGMYGKKLSQKAKKMISKAHKGRKDSDETRKRKSIALSGAGNGMYGKKMSKEHREIISKANKGRKQTKIQIHKRAIQQIGKIHINNRIENKFVTVEMFENKWFSLGYVRGMKKTEIDIRS